MTTTELRKLLNACLPARVMAKRGQLLYSGIETLRPGKFYFVGFNPAADGTNPPLSKVPLDRQRWSAYTQQCWYHPDCDHDRCPDFRLKPHQQRVQGIMRGLGLDPDETFATNLIFVESHNIAEIKKDMKGLSEDCWRVHEKTLAVVKPKYIVCLGNGECDSAFSLVRCKAKSINNVIPAGNKSERQRRVGFKSFDGTFALRNAADLNARVIGVPHPSRWNCPAGLNDFVFRRGMA